jgi:long-chain acyl-CoA synthetase
MRYLWEDFYPEGLSWHEAIPLRRIESFLEEAAEAWPERVAIDYYDHLITFRELLNFSARAAKGFQALGVGPGVHVGLAMPNSPHHVIAFFGILMAGGAIVNFSPLAAPRELKYRLVDGDVSVMVTLGSAPLYPQIAALKGEGKLTAVVTCNLEDFLPSDLARRFSGAACDPIAGPGSELTFAELTANDGLYVRHAHPDPREALAALQYTGGTTGDPKGAMLTHANFSAMIHMYRRWLGEARSDGSDVRLVVTPLFHISGSSFLLLALSMGIPCVLHARFDVLDTLSAIMRKAVTIVHLVPTMYTVLVGFPAAAKYDLRTLRLATSGGAPLPVEVIRQFQALTGVSIREGYALTETTGVGTMQADPGDGAPSVPGAVGPALPGCVVQILDLEGRGVLVMPGEKGEICFSGPHMMAGYWAKPEATRDAFRDGRFHTGDIGFQNEYGQVVVVDRLKDMIICGGFNVYPRIIEEVIYELSEIQEVAVVGVKDETFGQIVKAVIVQKPDTEKLTYNKLKRFLIDKVASYEMPTVIEHRSELPKTPAGKIAKRLLLDA